MPYYIVTEKIVYDRKVWISAHSEAEALDKVLQDRQGMQVGLPLPADNFSLQPQVTETSIDLQEEL